MVESFKNSRNGRHYVKSGAVRKRDGPCTSTLVKHPPMHNRNVVISHNIVIWQFSYDDDAQAEKRSSQSMHGSASSPKSPTELGNILSTCRRIPCLMSQTHTTDYLTLTLSRNHSLNRSCIFSRSHPRTHAHTHALILSHTLTHENTVTVCLRHKSTQLNIHRARARTSLWHLEIVPQSPMAVSWS